MKLGLFQLGDHVPVWCQTLDGHALSAPTACPTYRVYKDDSTLIETGSLPILDKNGATGQFGFDIFLNETYSTGQYTVLKNWIISAVTYGELDTFEIAAGGDSRGTPTSMHWFEQRGIRNLVYSTDGGHLIYGRDPIL